MHNSNVRMIKCKMIETDDVVAAGGRIKVFTPSRGDMIIGVSVLSFNPTRSGTLHAVIDGLIPVRATIDDTPYGTRGSDSFNIGLPPIAGPIYIGTNPDAVVYEEWQASHNYVYAEGPTYILEATRKWSLAGDGLSGPTKPDFAAYINSVCPDGEILWEDVGPPPSDERPPEGGGMRIGLLIANTGI